MATLTWIHFMRRLCPNCKYAKVKKTQEATKQNTAQTHSSKQASGEPDELSINDTKG
jgi:hypothetical protein